MRERLVFKVEDLPCPIEIVGENGIRVTYLLAPAGRKVGASLQVPNTKAKRPGRT